MPSPRGHGPNRMTPEAAHAEAVRRVRHARETGAAVLDLGDLPLTALPGEVAALAALRVLALGSLKAVPTPGGVAWEPAGERPTSPLADLSALAGLGRLEAVNLAVCQRLEDLSPLAGLAGLTDLQLGGCSALTDVSPLAALPALARLNLSHSKVSDLSPLAALPRLTDLDLNSCQGLTDLSPLAGLPALTRLNMNLCGNVADLSPLAGLTGLTALGVAWTAVADLSPLAGLPALSRLNLGGLGVPFAPVRPLLPRLDRLVLFCGDFPDLPPAVCGEHDADNVADAVRAHFADLDAGAAADAEVKLFVLGNGRVGKTQLVRRLRGEPFDEAVPSTHGVRLAALDLDVPGPPGPARVNVWDFGGQDVYHGSHALFVDRAAVFVVVWHPDFEGGEYEENGVPVRNHPLSYWLDYVRGVAESDTPVLVVQARCDDRADRREWPAADSDGLAVRTLEASAKTDRGLGRLREEVREAVGDLLRAHPPHRIGRGRAAVRDRLRGMLADDQRRPPADRRHRTLTRDEFAAVCADAGGVSSPDALLAFLHRTGVVFHRPGLFADRVVLDQQWALDAIYTLLDRARALPALRSRGRFTRADLEWMAWRDYTPDEQRTFLGMMEACGVCFRAGGSGDDTEYVAPELLPGFADARRDLLAGRVPRTPPDATAAARFRFPHEGVLRGLLSRVGRRAGDHASYWKYGCWFYEATTDSRALVEADWPGGGAVTFKAWGPDPVRLLDPLVAAAVGAAGGRPPEVTRSWGVPPPDGGADAPFVVPAVERLSPSPLPDDGGRSVAISYAHGDDLSDAGRVRGRVVDELVPRLEGWGYRVLVDRDVLRNGDLIREFMLRLGRAERVVVVLSDKYLRSPFCMTELHHVFQFALGQPGRFASRVVPVVLDDARVDDWRGRKGWAEYWDAEFRAMESAHHHLGARDRALCLQIRRWHADVGDMLNFLADVVAPRGYAAVSADGYRAVREMLDRPAGE